MMGFKNRELTLIITAIFIIILTAACSGNPLGFLSGSGNSNGVNSTPGVQIEATNPDEFQLASGNLQFVEMFSFW
jgi:hypothetical protein